MGIMLIVGGSPFTVAVLAVPAATMAHTDIVDREVRDLDAFAALAALIAAAAHTGGLSQALWCIGAYAAGAAVTACAWKLQWCGSGDIHISGFAAGIAALTAGGDHMTGWAARHGIGQAAATLTVAAAVYAAATVALAVHRAVQSHASRRRTAPLRLPDNDSDQEEASDEASDEASHELHDTSRTGAGRRPSPLAAALPTAACTLLLWPQAAVYTSLAHWTG